MSEQTNRPRRGRKDRWFLRADDGSIYGPATMKTLKAWCLEGRIEPDTALSRDQRAWVPAHAVPELEMDWIVRLEDGTCIGPFPLDLVPGLLENAIIPVDAVLEHRTTGETRPAAAREDPFAVVPEQDAPPARAAAEADVHAGIPLPDPMEESLQRSVDEARGQLAEARQALQQLRADHAMLQEDARRLQEELAAAQRARILSEQQLERERAQASRPPDARTAGKRIPLAPARSFLRIALPLVLLAMAVAGGWRSCRRSPDAPPAGDPAIAADAPGAPPLPRGGTLDLQPDTMLLPEPGAGLAPGTEPPAVTWPAITLPQASITRTARSMRIVFSNGLFSVSTRLTPEAQSALASLADQLRGKINGHQLMIEGHTDATPIQSGGSRYVDNFALGMARAETVMEFLVSTGRLPAESMRTASAGDSSPPYANDTEAGRMKNRTAILTLVIR